MTRRMWLALIVLVLIGLNVTAFAARNQRTWRADDELAATIAFDDNVIPCDTTASLDAPIEVASIVEAASRDYLFVHTTNVIAIAPKTSPPR